MKKRIFVVSALLSVLLSGCAISMDNTYKRSDYNDTVFANNYYKIKDKNIINNIKQTNTFTLDKTNDCVFENYEELKALGTDFDNKVANDEVTYDSLIFSNRNTTYGTVNCLGNIDDSFNHGILSKLTDGMLFCDGDTYQGVRVQIDKDGFVHEYEKKCLYADYFALSFKPGSDYTNNLYPPSATYDIKLNIKFYIEDGDKFVENICSYTMNSVSRNKYYLFGFKLTKNMAQNIKGLGISYDLVNSNEDASVDHCLHLYETLFVNSSWY